MRVELGVLNDCPGRPLQHSSMTIVIQLTQRDMSLPMLLCPFIVIYHTMKTPLTSCQPFAY